MRFLEPPARKIRGASNQPKSVAICARRCPRPGIDTNHDVCQQEVRGNPDEKPYRLATTRATASMAIACAVGSCKRRVRCNASTASTCAAASATSCTTA